MDGKFKEDQMYDASGRETDDIDLAMSKVEFRPHDFRFYEKRMGKKFIFFGAPVVVWRYHHRSSCFGSWMWPDGMPLRYDGVDNWHSAVLHAEKIGSNWMPRHS